ncbi:hypothetical protein [Micromonospora sp. WMMD714]|uniref:hypothetical protein n=1 Tax=Micromonospora sp. WMMD714 TaxID=3016097 RepID=UPI00249CF2C1|nr:hypothetical protein [Micromonospora sp. WMMD714]WFE63189.1 hypothetical protein O7625_07755 [Micromonospora sp. WMMD714]
MAGRSWGGSVSTALGVAAGVGAAQLGFGYGLGIINWAPVDAGASEPSWFASLAWATWIAAVSAVAGAVCAQRLHERGGADPTGGTLHRLTLAAAGAVGALITVLLVAVPSRAASVPDTFSPQTVAAGYAGVGVLVGLVAAVWTLHSRAAATNVIATVGWLWLLAVISVVDGVLAGKGLTSAQLGIWQIAQDSPRFWLRDHLYWPGALLALGSALLIGALAARRAARTAELRLGAVVSGAAGPLLVAVAYFLAVPRLATISPAQVSAHLVAPYAVIVGAAGSVLVASLAQRAERHAALRSTPLLPHPRSGGPDDLPAAPGTLPPSTPDIRTDRPAAPDGPAPTPPVSLARDTTTPARDMTDPSEDTTTPAQDTTAPGGRSTAPGGGTTTPGGDAAPVAVGRVRPARRSRATATATDPTAGGAPADPAPEQGGPGSPADPPAATVPKPRFGRRTS